jgi:hypothetical protein
MLNIGPSLIALSLGMIFPGVTLAAPDESAAIRAVIDSQAAAWNRGDIEAFMTGYAHLSTTTFVSGDEVTHDWQTVHDRYAKNYDSRDKIGTLTFFNLTITPLCDDTAIVLGSWRLERKSDEPHGKFTLLFASCQKAGESCLIIHRRFSWGRSGC